MSLCVGFLRGVNVAGRRVKNDALRSVFEGLGYDDVAPFLASGNVVFGSAGECDSGAEDLIERGLTEALGFAVPVFLRSAAEVARIASMQAFPAEVISRTAGNVQVAMLKSEASSGTIEAVQALGTPNDLIVFEGREMFWLPEGNMSDSKLDVKRVELVAGPMTIRARRTLVRIGERLA